MNIRSLTRGDGVVIGAAVLLFIASFLSLAGCDAPGNICDSYEIPNAWDSIGLGLGVYMGGVIGAALIVVARLLPAPRKVAGLELGPTGVALTLLTAWIMLWNLIDAENAGAGLILGFLAALILAGGAIATPSSPPSRPPSFRPPAPPLRSPTAGSRRVVTVIPGPSSRSPTVGSRRPGSRSGVGSRRLPRRPPVGTSRRSGSPCPCRGRCSRRTARRRRSPNWRRAPGTWPSSSVAPRWSRRRRTVVVVCCRTPLAFSAAESHSKPYRGPSPFPVRGRCRTVALRPRT